MDSKKYFPKNLIAKGNKLFGHTEWEFVEEHDDKFNLTEDGWDTIVSVHMEELPGCCGVAILTSLRSQKRNVGYSKFLMEAALYWVANKGYTLAIATTVAHKATDAIAAAIGAKEAATFTNRRTRNRIKVWTKTLPFKSEAAV